MAKKRVGKFPKAFRQMAVERMNNCENIMDLAKELGISDGCCMDKTLDQSCNEKHQSSIPPELFEEITDIFAEILVRDYQQSHSPPSIKNDSKDPTS